MEWKDVALIYGGQWIGKGIDKGVTMYVPDPYDKALTVGLAVGLPLATRFIKMGKTVETVAITIGGFLSTKIADYAEEMLAPAPVAVRRVAPRAVPWTVAETPGGAPEFYRPTYRQRVSPQVVTEKDHVRYVLT